MRRLIFLVLRQYKLACKYRITVNIACQYIIGCRIAFSDISGITFSSF